MSDEKKDVNSQQENAGKKGINKKLIIAFAGMGAVIVGLVIALILVATSGKKRRGQLGFKGGEQFCGGFGNR